MCMNVPLGSTASVWGMLMRVQLSMMAGKMCLIPWIQNYSPPGHCEAPLVSTGN